MAFPRADEMVWIGGRWWWFPGGQITVESQFEWRDSRAYVLEPDGGVTEGILLAREVVPD